MNPIQAAVEPRRQANVERAVSETRKTIAKLTADLSNAGWDIDVAAPYPRSTFSRIQYKRAKARRNAIEMITTSAEAFRRYNAPHIVKINDAAVENLIAKVSAQASDQFDAYVSKLNGKIGETVAAALNDAPLWNGSVLTVTTAAGEKQVWKTKMILNVSCLGKLFNQWPTRRVK